MRKRTIDVDMEKVIGILLAGGKGERLMPLTSERTKPSVPIGGTNRIIDFALTNYVRSGIRKIQVMTQYKSDSLSRHINSVWPISRDNIFDHYLELIPPQGKIEGIDVYQGTADAVYQNLKHIMQEKPTNVTIFSADHIYVMNIKPMLHEHIENNADLTICTQPRKKSECPINSKGNIDLGVLVADESGRVTKFLEKPNPSEVEGENIFVSMGNYIFKPKSLEDNLSSERRDFGKDVIPHMIQNKSKVYMYDFSKNIVPGMNEEYEKNLWYDLGTIDQYYEASMMLTSTIPKINLYNKEWNLPIPQASKTVHSDGIRDNIQKYKELRIGGAFDSLISPGSIISGGIVLNSILSPGARIHSYSEVIDSVLFDDVDVARYAKVKKSIIDKNVKIPEGVEIGYNKELDLERGFTISPGGITVVPKDYDFSKYNIKN